MSNDYRSYTFTQGKDPTRVYQGKRISPREGIELGAELVDLLTTVWDGLIGAEGKCAKRKETPLSEDTEKNSLYDLITVYSSCYNHLDKKKYFSMFDKIMDKTIIVAKKDGEKNSNVHLQTSNSSFDDWFSEFPQDLVFFTAAVLVENAAPFLPEFWKKKLGGMGLSTAESLKTLFQSSSKEKSDPDTTLGD